jgi:acetolactate synthase-1/2/3 large subunit
MEALGKVAAQAIAAAGVRRCYTVPAEVVWLLDAIEAHPALSLISARHESSAAFMAEADAKLTGIPTVLLTGRSPGATNASNGVHSALDSSTPMLVLLSDTDTRHARREAFQQLDLMAFYAPITKACFRATPEDSLPELIAHGLRLAAAGRPGPVMVTIPQDLPKEVTPWTPRPLSGMPTPAPPSGADIDAIAQLLNAARQPVIIAGGGAQRCRTDLVRVAERFSLGVYSAFRRQDVFPNDHPLYLGHLGMPAPRATLTALADADLVFAVGARLSQTTTQFFRLPRPGTRLIQVDIDPSRTGTFLPATVGVAADAGVALRALANRPGPAAPRDWTAGHAAFVHSLAVPSDRSGEGVDPAQVVKAMVEALPEDAIVTNDAGAFAGYVHQHWMFRHPASQAGTSTGTMGYAVPAAVAAKLGQPGRSVVAAVGDGGFLMNGQEIETAVRYQAPIIVAVFNNHHLLAVAPGADLAYNRIVDVDFAAYARAFGALGLTVRKTTELTDAFRAALAADRVTVIDIKTDPKIFQGFVEASPDPTPSISPN